MDIRLEAVTVLFDGRPALRELTLALPEGARLGISGLPASGKTTLLKVLTGLRRPDEGRVLWDGEDAWAISAQGRRDKQAAFGMVFQTDALFDSSTVLENVRLPLVRRGASPDEATRVARQALSDVGILDAAALLPEQLSGGMKKRAGIARAIAARPAVLVADDPLAGLDPSTASQVGEILARASEGRTLVVAAPDPDRLLRVHRWRRMDDGRLSESEDAL